MGIRSRNFAFLVYPESCIYDYKNMIINLSRLGVPTAISPLHCPDEDTKKEHFHVLITFDGVKSIDSLENLNDIVTNEIFDFHNIVNCNNISKSNYPHFIAINSLCSYYRYLYHADNLEKQQFPTLKILHGVKDIVSNDDRYNSLMLLNGFNNRDYADRATKISEDIQIVQIIEQENIRTCQELIFYLAKAKNEHLLNYIHKNVYFVKNFIFGNESFIKKVEELRK